MEGVHIELTHVENGILPTGFSHDAHRFRVGIARETAGIFQQRADALVFLHFVVHRTLHLTRDFHQTVVGLDDDEVVVGEADVARLLAVEDIVIDIDRRNEFVVAIDLDVTQRTDVADAVGHIEGVEHRGEGRQRVGSGRFHLVHHVHGDGARLSDGEFHPTALIAASQRRTQARVGLFYGHSANIHGSETIDVHVSVGTHRRFNLLGRRAVNVDIDGIARAENVVLRCRHVHRRLKSQVFLAENVASEHFLLLFLALGQNLLEHRNGIHRQQSADFRLHLQEIVVVLVVVIFPDALALHSLRRHFRRLFLGVVLARAVVGLRHRLVLHHAQSGILFLALGNLLHTANLLDIDTSLHQFRHDLFFVCTRLVFLEYETNHLIVSHRRLGCYSQGHKQPNQNINDGFLHILIASFTS